jgi:mRNA-degrading endonuclease RelE of RelBE toxin-antitoxin system
VKYQVLLHPKAARALQKLDRQITTEIKKKLRDNPHLGKPLKHSNFSSLRIGDYRAIYEISPKEERVIVLYISHMKNVYEDFTKMFWV